MTNPRNELRHEYSAQDALMTHGILGARWAALQHEDEIKHYGVKGMKWGVRKDGKPQGYQGPGKNSGKANSVIKSTPTGTVPAGGGGGGSSEDEEEEKDLTEIVDDLTPAQRAYLNQLMEEQKGLSADDIRAAAKKTFTKDEEAALLKPTFSERAGQTFRDGLDAVNRFGERTGITDKIASAGDKISSAGDKISSAKDAVVDTIKDHTRSTTSRTSYGAGGVETKVSETRDGHGNLVGSSTSTTKHEPEFVVDRNGKVTKNPKFEKRN